MNHSLPAHHSLTSKKKQQTLGNINNCDDESNHTPELIDSDTDDDIPELIDSDTDDISPNNTTQSSIPAGFDTQTNHINALMDNLWSPLYFGATYTLFECILAIFRTRTYNTSQTTIATIFTLLQGVLPNGNILPSFQDACFIIRRYWRYWYLKISTTSFTIPQISSHNSTNNSHELHTTTNGPSIISDTQTHQQYNHQPSQESLDYSNFTSFQPTHESP